MKLILNKLDEFLKAYPNCRSFLQSIVEKEKDKMNLVRDETVKMFEKAKELCEYDVANFKKSVLPGFKYKLELLKTNDLDCEFLENSIKSNDNFLTKILKYLLGIKNKTEGLKIYSVVPNDNILTESSDSSQILLLHGTKAQNVEGILKTGFNPSKKGSYGPGVYLTNSFKYAYDYCKSYATEENVIKHFRHFFVNSVPNPEICQDNKPYQNNTSFEDYLKNEPSVKMYSYSLNKLSSKVGESHKALYDSYNRNIFNGSFQNIDQQKIALAHHHLVVPAYLIEIEKKIDIDYIVNEILFDCLNIECCIENDSVNDMKRKTNKENTSKNEVSDFVFTMIEENLKKIIDRNYHALIDCLTSELEYETNSVIKQLSFQFSSIYKENNDEKRKFIKELLHKDDDDYKFILRSIDNKNAKNFPKVRQIFRINPVDKSEVLNLKEKYIYLNGVKADKVQYVLTNGYPNDQSSVKEFDSVLQQTTTVLSIATCFGRNYCEVDITVKKLSFVFVVCSNDNYKNMKKKTIIEDSRKSVTKEGIFSNVKNGVLKNNFDLIPAYLIIFELDK